MCYCTYDVPISRQRSPARCVKIILNRRDPGKEEYSHLRVFAFYIILYCQTDTVVGYRMTVRGSWELKEEALDRPLWGTGFGRDCVSVVRQTTSAILTWGPQTPVDRFQGVREFGLEKNYHFIFTNLLTKRM